MLPITSMFIVNRAGGERRKEKQHALVYLIGMVGTYMLLGLLAGLTGGAFNSVMQSAFVNLAFAVFFAFFALSLLGFYELSFMQNEVHTLDQKSSKVAGLLGTWLMGSVAGLVISPCVGPIVFALLLQVADNMAAQADALAAMNQTLGFWDKFDIAAQGGLIMSGFGLGVGLPFFGVGIIKFRNLPKAGYWMNKIKYAFGLVILYFAYTYLHKGLGIWGVADEVIVLLAVAMLALWFAIVHCNVLSAVQPDATPNEKLYRYCGVIALLTGGWLFIVSMEQMPIIKTAEAESVSTVVPSVTAQPAEVTEGGIVWQRQFAEAQKIAQQTGKPIFIDFYASWCANCVAFKEETQHNPMLNRVLKEDAIALKLVDGEAEFEHFREKPEHRPLKIGLPYFAILTPDGQLAWSGTDYQATDTMIKQITQLSHSLPATAHGLDLQKTS
jgi:thiol:disulfide interchange protein DsbD